MSTKKHYLRVTQSNSITRRCKLIANNTKKVLAVSSIPKEYQEVEYLESSNGQLIDTGIVPKSTTKIDCLFNTTQNVADYYRNYIFGCDINGDGIQYSYSPTGYYGAGGANSMPSLSVNRNRHHIVVDKSVFVFDDEVIFTGGTNYTTTKNMLIFGSNSSVTYTSNCRIYYCKIYNNNTLVRDFVPCFRRSDNVIGMYDKVNNTFYTNAGTGTFIKGKNV